MHLQRLTESVPEVEISVRTANYAVIGVSWKTCESVGECQGVWFTGDSSNSRPVSRGELFQIPDNATLRCGRANSVMAPESHVMVKGLALCPSIADVKFETKFLYTVGSL
jgi:hypothetical protein